MCFFTVDSNWFSFKSPLKNIYGKIIEWHHCHWHSPFGCPVIGPYNFGCLPDTLSCKWKYFGSTSHASISASCLAARSSLITLCETPERPKKKRVPEREERAAEQVSRQLPSLRGQPKSTKSHCADATTGILSHEIVFETITLKMIKMTCPGECWRPLPPDFSALTAVLFFCWPAAFESKRSSAVSLFSAKTGHFIVICVCGW